MAVVDLAGSRWVALEVGGRAALVDATPSAAFDADGSVSGSTGINRFRATYRVVGDELTLGQTMSTRMAGPPVAMAQEQLWLEVLGQVCRVRRDGDRLILDDGATVLVLVAVAGEPDPGD
jgi:heat shock protein HslJ